MDGWINGFWMGGDRVSVLYSQIMFDCLLLRVRSLYSVASLLEPYVGWHGEDRERGGFEVLGSSFDVPDC